MKKKTRLSLYIGEELGEWIRQKAFELRVSQAELVRQILKEAKEK